MAGGLDFGTLLQALTAADQQAEKNSPFRGVSDFSDAFSQKLITDSARGPDKGGLSTGEGIIAGLISGLISGGSRNLTEGYRTKQSDMAADYLQRSVFGGGPAERPSGMSPSVFAPVNAASKLFGAQDAYVDREKAADLKNQLTLSAFEAVGKNPALADKILAGYGKLAGAPTEIPNEPMVEPPAQPGLFPGSGKSVDQEFNELVPKYVNEYGLTPNAAADIAISATAAKRKANTDAMKQISEARTQAESMLKLADTAERGVSGAGNTGGFFGPVRDLASRAWATVDSDEATQRSYQGLLDSVAPDVIRSSRTAGVGAMSDPEMRAYLAAGPTSSKTPQENRILIDKLRATGSLQRDYADFLEAFVEERGNTVGAAQLWNAYTAQNPLFDSEYNTRERTPWRDWVKSLNGKMPDTPSIRQLESNAAGGAPQGAQPTGRTSGGKPVYRLPDGKLWVE